MQKHTQKSTNNPMSSFGLIEENIELAHIHLAVTHICMFFRAYIVSFATMFFVQNKDQGEQSKEGSQSLNYKTKNLELPKKKHKGFLKQN